MSDPPGPPVYYLNPNPGDPMTFDSFDVLNDVTVPAGLDRAALLQLEACLEELLVDAILEPPAGAREERALEAYMARLEDLLEDVSFDLSDHDA